MEETPTHQDGHQASYHCAICKKHLSLPSYIETLVKMKGYWTSDEGVSVRFELNNPTFFCTDCVPGIEYGDNPYGR